MIAVISYVQHYDETDCNGKIIRPKGAYVDYGVDVNTMESVCLPSENYATFCQKHCYWSEAHQAYIIK